MICTKAFKYNSLVLLLFLVLNVFAQNEKPELNKIDSSLEFTANVIELTDHPLQQFFKTYQNNLKINPSSHELAGTFDDPSRALYRHVGMSLQNDQSNAVVYRGLPSEYIKWSIQGAEIINPNHLNNAGRISDESSPNAGGVMAFPFEVINDYNFFGNAYGPHQVNALSGVGDFSFTGVGNSFVKMGLLGMELALRSQGKIKISTHLRYSTVGLLSDFGVDFDGESIKFYDAFFKADFSEQISFTLSVGKSTNYHKPIENLSMASQLKDLQEIDFSSEFFIAGLNIQQSKINHSLFVSKRKNERTSFLDSRLFTSNLTDSLTYYFNDQTKVSYSGLGKFGQHNSYINIGLQVTYENNDLRKKYLDSDSNNFVIRPSFSWDRYYNFGEFDTKFSPGISVTQYKAEAPQLDPSLFLQLAYKSHILEFNFSQKTEKQNVDLSPIDIDVEINKILALSLAWKLHLQGMDINVLARVFHLNLESPSYYVSSFINGYNNFDFSSGIDNNLFEKYDFGNQHLSSEGVEFMIDKSWENGWYVNTNLTLFKARFEDLQINTNENYKRIFNLNISKKIALQNHNTCSFNLAYHSRGGGFQNDYNHVQNQFTERQLSNYSRIDLRVEYKWNIKNKIVLDIQNLTNKINDAYYYYDAFLEDEVLVKQQGTIPIVSYTRLF